MDLSTTIGLILGVGLLLSGILSGSELVVFLDAPAIAIVFGGTLGAVMVGFPFQTIQSAIRATKGAFFKKDYDIHGTVHELSRLSERARLEGLLALQSEVASIRDPFMRRGLELAANGHEAASIEAAMIEEIDGVEHGRMESIAVFDAVGSYAPAMGMLGTLIGLVQMLQSLDDPSALGPAMAVALLTTFYGAFLAHMVAIPIANKLRSRSEDQVGQMELVARGVLAIVSGESPRLMASRLHVALGPQLRLQVAA